MKAARRRLACEEAVIPCEHSGVLHGNWSGPLRGFASQATMRDYYGVHVQRIKDVDGDILKSWHALDPDFTLQYFSLAGAAMPPYRKLQPRVRHAMEKSDSNYQKAFAHLSEEERSKVRYFEALWPLGTPEELKECCLQPQDAITMRLTYATGATRLDILYKFSKVLARHAGATQPVEWSVKRPWRLWRKTIEKFPEEFADHDFRHCCDVFRTSIVVDNLGQIEQILDILESLGRDAYDRDAVLQRLGLKETGAVFLVERIKNRFVEPCVGGYMDVIANVRINGYVTEVQLHLQRLLDIKGDTGRTMYKWFRSFTRKSNQYAGEKSEDGRMHGAGTYYPLSGGRYDGEFQGGKRHGEGTFYYPNGDRYEGNFEGGRKHGRGTYSYASGDRYEGDFVDDRMEGTGTFFFVNGERFEGEYSEGKRHGEGAYYYNNGSCLQGEWWRNKHISVVSV